MPISDLVQVKDDEIKIRMTQKTKHGTYLTYERGSLQPCFKGTLGGGKTYSKAKGQRLHTAMKLKKNQELIKDAEERIGICRQMGEDRRLKPAGGSHGRERTGVGDKITRTGREGKTRAAPLRGRSDLAY